MLRFLRGPGAKRKFFLRFFIGKSRWVEESMSLEVPSVTSAKPETWNLKLETETIRQLPY